MCAALVLLRRLMPGFTMAFCPMGPVGAQNDREAMQCFVDGIRAYCKKAGVYQFKMMPPLVMMASSMGRKATGVRGNCFSVFRKAERSFIVSVFIKRLIKKRKVFAFSDTQFSHHFT